MGLIWCIEKRSDWHEKDNNYRLKVRPQLWPLILTSAMTLTLKLSISDIWFAKFPEKKLSNLIFYLLYFQEIRVSNSLPQNEKQTYRLNTRPQMKPRVDHMAMTLILDFQGRMNEYLFHRNRCLICYILDKNGWFKKHRLNARPD